MTIAIQPKLVRTSTLHPLVKLNARLTAPMQRLWWHIHAYAVIFAVMTLSVLSVIVLFIHDRLERRYVLLALTSLISATMPIWFHHAE